MAVAAARRSARWRSPASWPLRTRLVAILIGLLVVLGLVVGGTAEIYLKSILYNRLDAQVQDASNRALGGPPEMRRAGGSSDNMLTEPPAGAQTDQIFVAFRQAGSGRVTVLNGGIVAYKQSTDSDSDGYTPFNNVFNSLSTEVLSQLGGLNPNDASARTIDLGDLGNYRVMVTWAPDGQTMVVSGVPMKSTESTLLAVALVTGGAVVGSLIVAGWAGAVIIRRTLKPLNRVAATATRVSELKLDRGEVQLAQRVPAAFTDPGTEVGAVGSALNRMLDHVGNALEARHASEMQVRQFVADASHELRTPLAAIRGYAELSRRSRQPVPDEISHVLRRVESEALRMTALVEDLLLLARLDAGRPLAQDPVDLTMLAVDVVSDAHASSPRHNWQLDLPNEPVTVIGDQQRLHQVLANLLANARTHTPEGTTVVIGVGVHQNAAVLRVTDFGPGIPADLQPKIFERFARGDSSRSRAAGSTGLGLSIVHSVVTAHRGTVGVRSVPGQTEFTVLLPLSPPAPMSQPQAKPIHQHVAQVLQ